MTTTSILNLAEGSNGSVVYCDTSRVGLGYVLSQRYRVIVYASRQIKVHEKNYPTYDLEFAIVVFALNICRHHFMVFTYVFIDHKRIQYVLT